MYQWKKGISLSFFCDDKGETNGADGEVLEQVSRHGFDCVELSFSHDDYFEKYRFTEGDNAEKLYERCKALGLELWSIHLPFSEKWDLSAENAEKAVLDDMELIKAAAKAHISVAVIHPSFEPVEPNERAYRLAYAKKNIERLNRFAKESNVVLALENLPRTCLGNCSEEMIDLLNGTGAAFVFDTNHSLEEDNVVFLKRMLAHGYCPVSLHISDYDFIDERHELPGQGLNSWGTLLTMLSVAGYQGPAMYEISSKRLMETMEDTFFGKKEGVSMGEKKKCFVLLDAVSENMRELLSGKIS